MANRRNDPIVSDADPFGPGQWWRAFRDLFRGGDSVIDIGSPPPKDVAPPPPPRPALQSSDEPAQAAAQPAEPSRPAKWASPVFQVAAAVYAIAELSRFAPKPLRDFYAVAAPDLLDRLQWLLERLPGWTLIPWYVGLATVLMRLRAAHLSNTAIRSAVNWGMVAVTIDVVAWVMVARRGLADSRFSDTARLGWQLLAAEFIFLLAVGFLYAPRNKRPVIVT